VILGILLIVAGFILIALAASSGHRGVLIASILGALFTLGAAFNGASFLNFNDDLSSMIMAGLFAAAMACYVVVLFHLNNAPAPAGTGNEVS
jgi:drug/metabolite transporter (DMT)-like permease